MEANSRKNKQLPIILSIPFLFFTGAFIGWGYEVLLHLLCYGTFVNRGVLHGPWLPIYGVGCVLIILLKKWIGKKPFTFFSVSVVGCAVLEYVTSWLLETVYHTRWWDYSNLPLNLNGRIFLGGLLGFGIAGLLFAYLVFPWMEKQFNKIPIHIQKVITALLVVIFLFDAVISLLFPNMGLGISQSL